MLVWGVALAGAPPAQAQFSRDILKTDSGAPLKLIVRRDTALYEQPVRSPRSDPVRKFKFFYALPVDGPGQKLKNDFYKVASGPAGHLAAGWIHKDDVVEWPHRQALGFRPRTRRERAQFYLSLGDLRTAYGGRNPTSPVPISREPENHTGLALLPILGEHTARLDGDEVAAYHVAYLHSQGEEGGARSSVSREQLQREMTLDVAFVIDATESMTPWIEGAKQVVRRVTETIAADSALQGRVRFALVAYRDDGDEFVTRTFATFAQGSHHGSFLARLEEVRANGGGDIPERVAEGLRVAIEDLAWNRVGYKHIILIGDASSHGKPSLEEVLIQAQPTGLNEAIWQKITIHALQCGLPPFGDDSYVCQVQFKQLAAGRDYPGLYGDFKDVDDYVTKLVELIRGRVGYVRDIAEGKNTDVVERGKDDCLIGPLLEMVRSVDEGDPKVASFASGYVAEVDMAGNRMLEPHVLVTYSQLEMFHAAMDFCVKALENAGEPGEKDVNKIVSNLQILATQVNLGELVDLNTELSKILTLMLEVPVRNAIFRMTPARLAAMTESDYQSWVRQVRASQAVLKAQIDNKPIWFNLGKEIQPQYRHSFVKITDLP